MNQLEKATQDFLAVLDTVEQELRIYDAALRFAKSNHEKEAEVFENCMAVVSVDQGLLDLYASPELQTLRRKARELCALFARDLGNQSKL